MDTDDSAQRDDDFDPTLRHRFEELTSLDAPDIWDRVRPVALPPATGSPPGDNGGDAGILMVERIQNGSDFRLRAAVVVVVLVGLGLLGLSLASGSDEGQSEIAEDTQPNTSLVPIAEKTLVECTQNIDVILQFRPGLPLVDYVPTASLEELVALSEQRVFGRLRSSAGHDGGTILTLEGPEIDRLWIPARLPDGELNGFAVAFLSGEMTGPNGTAAVVLPEGLWVACEPTEMTFPALGAPTELGWRKIQREMPTLDELWNLAAMAESGRTEIGPAVYRDDDVAVYRIGDGDVSFRLSLPAALADDHLVLRRKDGAFTNTSGENLEIALSLADSCDSTGSDEWRPNDLGSIVSFQAEAVLVCRPAEGLKMTITSALVADIDMNGFDIRSVGAVVRRAGEYGPGVPELGPFNVGGFVITRVGESALVGLNPFSLKEIWRYESADPLLWPTVKQSALLAGEGSRLVRLDPANGDELWSAEFPDDGIVAYLLDAWDGRVLRFASSDFDAPDQTSAVEKIDVSTGEVLWRATGRSGGDWSTTVPIQTNGVILAGENLVSDQASSVTYAIDDATGEVLWVSDFEIGDARYIAEGAFASYIVTRDRAALIMRTVNQGVVRVDPQTGEILWSVVVQWGPIIGRQVAADGITVGVAVSTPAGTVLLDPFTGERLPQ